MIDAQNEIARNVALRQLADAVGDADVDLSEDGVGDMRENAALIAEQILTGYAASFEWEVNDAGVAVRRVVLRGEWLVDPDIATRLSGAMVIVENDRERVGANAVRDALTALALELHDGPRVWTERALDGVRLDRVQAAVQRAAERLGLRL